MFTLTKDLLLWNLTVKEGQPFRLPLQRIGAGTNFMMVVCGGTAGFKAKFTAGNWTVRTPCSANANVRSPRNPRNQVANITENSAVSAAGIAHELIGLDPPTAA